jgi:hypothetical protein
MIPPIRSWDDQPRQSSNHRCTHVLLLHQLAASNLEPATGWVWHGCCKIGSGYILRDDQPQPRIRVRVRVRVRYIRYLIIYVRVRSRWNGSCRTRPIEWVDRLKAMRAAEVRLVRTASQFVTKIEHSFDYSLVSVHSVVALILHGDHLCLLLWCCRIYCPLAS